MTEMELQESLSKRENTVRDLMQSSSRRSSVFPIGAFTLNYAKIDKTAFKLDGTGFLQAGAAVVVHDIGLNEDGTMGRYAINGVECSEDSDDHLEASEERHLSIHALKNSLPRGLLENGKPDWAKVRWIDVEGMNGEIIQYLLELTECDRQYTFDNIVNLKQNVLGMLLSDEDYEETSIGNNNNEAADDHKDKFLMISKMTTLTPAALNQQIYKSDQLCMLEEDNIIDLEQISYILYADQRGDGTLISFQEGKEGDCYSEIREMLAFKSAKTHKRGVGHLFMQLVRASTESAALIERYLEDAIDQLYSRIEEDPENVDYINAARSIQHECDMLERILVPYADTLMQMTQGFFPPSCRGNSKAAWMSLAFQQKRMGENLKGHKMRVLESITYFKDYQEQKEVIRQKNIEKSSFLMGVTLSVFSPLAFLSGVYGTNFQKSDGTPGVPELRWGWRPSDPNDPSSPSEWDGGITGYGYFWILCGAVVASILSMYIYVGLIDISAITEPIKSFVKRIIGRSCTTCFSEKMKKRAVMRGKRGSFVGKVSPRPEGDSDAHASDLRQA